MRAFNKIILISAFTLIFNSIFVCQVFSIDEPEIDFEPTFSYFITNPAMLWVTAEDVEQTTDGGYIITGTLNNQPGDSDAYLLKTYDDGTKEWAYSYNLTGSDIAKAVQQTSDGGYIFVGQKGTVADVILYNVYSTGKRRRKS